MVIFLEITAGPDEGLKFKAQEGLMIGRVKGQVLLNDPKVSSLHAAVELDNKGQMILVDQGSSNRLLINGRKVKRIALLPGVIFELGRTQIKVIQLPEEEAEAYGSVITWRSILKEEIASLGGQNIPTQPAPMAFSSALVLQFLQRSEEHNV